MAIAVGTGKLKHSCIFRVTHGISECWNRAAWGVVMSYSGSTPLACPPPRNKVYMLLFTMSLHQRKVQVAPDKLFLGCLWFPLRLWIKVCGMQNKNLSMLSERLSMAVYIVWQWAIVECWWTDSSYSQVIVLIMQLFTLPNFLPTNLFIAELNAGNLTVIDMMLIQLVLFTILYIGKLPIYVHISSKW